ncbi:hypothetical protein C0995_014137 [Termitomyces sp. Mi166|nr:hypothetical protein C0995_014137 [Termitomyces sp. Mi166\
MIPTPDLSHLTAKDYDHVYEPAEDTFLLLDALEEDERELKDLNPSISLEIGSGSGCVSAFIGKILGPSVMLDVINASFASPLTTRLKRAVDIILFNPPYVPTMPEEMSDAQDRRGISGSWAGGTDGMNVTNIFLDQVEELLSEQGRFYLVAVAENNVPGIQERMSRLYGLRSDP